MKIELSGEVKRLNRRPGDAFLVTTKHELTQEASTILTNKLMADLNAPVIVLCEDMQLAVLGTPHIDARMVEKAVSCLGWYVSPAALETVASNLNRLIDEPRKPDIEKYRQALVNMLAEWDRLTQYGSHIAKSANERVDDARKLVEGGD